MDSIASPSGVLEVQARHRLHFDTAMNIVVNTELFFGSLPQMISD